MLTPEECAKAVMRVFVELTERPLPKKAGWQGDPLSRKVLRQKIGDDKVLEQGINYAMERQWIVETAPGTDIYMPTRTGFTECWDP
jgi:hypothetical protein